MKMLLMIGMLLSAAPVFASEPPTCPNFTGTYKWIDQIASVYMSVYQTGCDSVDVFYDYGGGTTALHQLTFDGKKHTIFDNPALLSVETYSWTDGKIMIKGVDHWFKEGKTITNTEMIYFDAAGQIVDETTAVNQDGQVVSKGSMTYKRM